MGKKFWIKKCLKPGVRGEKAIKDLSKIWGMINSMESIPLLGSLIALPYKLLYPSQEEVEAAIRNNTRK